MNIVFPYVEMIQYFNTEMMEMTEHFNTKVWNC